MLNLNYKIQSKTIRVFLSSTFADMHEEREYLINTIFPYLRSVARKRNVDFTEIDLRWGITEEEAKNGEVVRLCLKEIDLCKEKSDELPFFIGLIGERYGWQPNENEANQRLFDEIDEAKNYIKQKLSVTEMEIDYAILKNVNQNPQLKTQSYFYYRSPEYTQKLKEENPKVTYVDSDESLKHKLKNLKDKIEKLENEPTEYLSKEKLGEQIITDFERFMDKYFGEIEKDKESFNIPLDNEAKTDKRIKLLEEEQGRQAIFAQSRTKLYVERKGLFSQIDQLLQNNKQVVVTAGVGMGKTSLMANYIAYLQRKENAPEIIYHFCGGALHSDNLKHTQRRIIAEFQHFSGREIENPDKDEELAKTLITEILSLPKDKKVILTIDALDQLDTIEFFNWLPKIYPEHVNIVVSVKSPFEGEDHPILNTLKERNFINVNIEPLDKAEREQILKQALGSYGRKLPKELLSLVSQSKESGNPLVLLTLIEEMRLLGRHDSLEMDILDYISTNSYEQFFEKVLQRIERDFPFAKDVISFIGSSRMGLSEHELIELMNIGDNTEMTNMQWSGLYETLRPHLKEQDGNLTWFHGIISRAVTLKYLTNENKLNYYRQKQIVFFSKNRMSERTLFNLPWLYSSVKDWITLGKYLSDSNVFFRLNKLRIDLELGQYIYNLENHFNFYKHITENINEEDSLPKDKADKFLTLALFYTDIFEYEKVIDLFTKSLLIYRELDIFYPNTYQSEISILLNNLGKVNNDLQNHDVSLMYYQEALDWSRRLKEINSHLSKKGIALIKNNLGNLHAELKDYKLSLVHYKESLDIRKNIATSTKEKNDIAETLNNIGNHYVELEDYKTALFYHQEALEIRKNLAQAYPIYNNVLAKTLNSLGAIYIYLQDFNNSIIYFKEALVGYQALKEINPVLYSKKVALSTKMLGFAYKNSGDIASSKTFYSEALLLYKELAESYSIDFNHDVIKLLKILEELYENLNDQESSLEYYKKTLNIYKDLAANHPESYDTYLANSFVKIGEIYGKLSDHQSSINYFNDGIKIWRELVKSDIDVCGYQFAVALNDLGYIYEKLNDIGSSFKLFIEALNIWQALAKSDPFTHMTNFAFGLHDLGCFCEKYDIYSDALDYYKESLKIHEMSRFTRPDNYNLNLAKVNRSLGTLCYKLKQKDNSLAYFEEALKYYRESAESGPNPYQEEIGYISYMIIQAKTSLKDRVFRFGLIFILPVSLGIYLGLITPWLWFISIPLIIIPIGLLVISKSKKASEIIKKMAFEISEK